VLKATTQQIAVHELIALPAPHGEFFQRHRSLATNLTRLGPWRCRITGVGVVRSGARLFGHPRPGLEVRYVLVCLDYDVAGDPTVIDQQENRLGTCPGHQLFVLGRTVYGFVVDFLNDVAPIDSRRGRRARRID
jgi:hypothetical protein